MPRHIRPVRVEGNNAFVPLTRGYEAIIDAADAAFVGQWNWFALPKTNTVYAARWGREGEPRTVRLHRVLLDPPQDLGIDHVNRNGLDNRRGNLRLATRSENMWNSAIQVNNTSGFKGVSWVKRDKKWAASIRVFGKTNYLGYFETAEQAHEAYARASAEMHGEFGRLS
jgi:HNH endonuclease/AP2 domain